MGDWGGVVKGEGNRHEARGTRGRKKEEKVCFFWWVGAYNFSCQSVLK
jgi:hypothetical protein